MSCAAAVQSPNGCVDTAMVQSLRWERENGKVVSIVKKGTSRAFRAAFFPPICLIDCPSHSLSTWCRGQRFTFSDPRLEIHACICD